jgi:hypothetical protein
VFAAEIAFANPVTIDNGNMVSAVGSDAVTGGVAGPGAGGVVSRPRLFARLAAPARVTVVSGPPGSGRVFNLRVSNLVNAKRTPTGSKPRRS